MKHLASMCIEMNTHVFNEKGFMNNKIVILHLDILF